MPSTAKQVDDATTIALVNAFNIAVNELNEAERTVMNSSADLGATWLGDASRRYQEGLQEVSNGLVTIRTGLNGINEQMRAFAAVTSSTEDDNLAQAAGVMLSNDSFSAGSSWTN